MIQASPAVNVMATISVLPDYTTPRHFRAISGGKQFIGTTVGDAIDGLNNELGDSSETTLVVVQPMKPDQFFTGEQQARLASLMDAWRIARDAGLAFPSDQKKELDTLVRDELIAATKRAKHLLDSCKS
jgi:hypothetical protein